MNERFPFSAKSFSICIMYPKYNIRNEKERVFTRVFMDVLFEGRGFSTRAAHIYIESEQKETLMSNISPGKGILT